MKVPTWHVFFLRWRLFRRVNQLRHFTSTCWEQCYQEIAVWWKATSFGRCIAFYLWQWIFNALLPENACQLWCLELLMLQSSSFLAEMLDGRRSVSFSSLDTMVMMNKQIPSWSYWMWNAGWTKTLEFAYTNKWTNQQLLGDSGFSLYDETSSLSEWCLPERA